MKVREQGPDPPLPTAHVNVTVPTASTASPLGKGDPPASIMGRLPCPLGKTKPGQRSWQISDPEFQNALQIARAVWPADLMGEQYVIIYHMTKHKRQQNHIKTTLLFMIPNIIAKELADMMQVWLLNESTCPLAMRHCVTAPSIYMM